MTRLQHCVQTRPIQAILALGLAIWGLMALGALIAVPGLANQAGLALGAGLAMANFAAHAWTIRRLITQVSAQACRHPGAMAGVTVLRFVAVAAVGLGIVQGSGGEMALVLSFLICQGVVYLAITAVGLHAWLTGSMGLGAAPASVPVSVVPGGVK